MPTLQPSREATKSRLVLYLILGSGRDKTFANATTVHPMLMVH